MAIAHICHEVVRRADTGTATVLPLSRDMMSHTDDSERTKNLLSNADKSIWCRDSTRGYRDAHHTYILNYTI